MTDKQDLYQEAMKFAKEKASISYVQRKCRCSYNDAERMLEQMVSEGVISTYNGRKGGEAVGAGGVSGPLINRTSLSANAGEPVAWRYLTPTGWHATTDVSAALRIRSHHDVDPLYAAPPTAQAEGWTAEQALRNVLAAVQRYMPPDGPDAKDTLSEIIAIVDPWPLGPLEKS